MRFITIAIIALSVIGCQQKQEADSAAAENIPQLFEQLTAKETGIDFINKIENTEALNIFSYRNFYNGAGVSIGDVNNDGLSDVYLTSNLGKNKLFLNKGNMEFEDISASAGVEGTKGWSTGVVMVDINNDGLLDIYVCNAGFKTGDLEYYNKEALRNELFINNGDLTFTEKAAEYNLDNNGYSTHAAFFDYDMDGDLDAYILNNSLIQPSQLNYNNDRDLADEKWPVKDYIMGGGDKLMRNDNGKFTDVTEKSGIHSSIISFGLGITVGDVNGDNYPDMYVSNDFYERDYLYINQKNGTFKDDITNRMGHLSLSSMGADMADINNDGFPEIFVTEMLPDDEYRVKTVANFDSYTNFLTKVKKDFHYQFMHNTLQLNNQNETFSEIAFYSGVAASDWSWGALMFDMDNDGYRDIYVSNGIYQDVIDQDFISFFATEADRMAKVGTKTGLKEMVDKMPSNPVVNKAFHNNGNLTFTDRAEVWGMGLPSFSNGAAYGDLDNDGDLDLIVNNVNQELFVFKNKTNEKLDNHYLTIDLKGSDKNTFAIGSKIKIKKEGQLLNFELIPTRGFQSSVDYKTVFGLGKSTKVDELQIIWFDNTVTTIANPAIDQTLKIDYKTAERKPMTQPTPLASGMVQEMANTFRAHQEDDYFDFFFEGLTPRMLSREGPCMAVGDVNGDGLEDVFIGGAADQAGQLYVQTANGFEPVTNLFLERSAFYEDVVATFFDADKDGDLDLLVGSGGNHLKVNDMALRDRLYFNDGKGNLVDNPSALPPSGFNTGAIVAFDFDEDGDLDLFVGNRSIPQNYGIAPYSYLLENDGKGNFKNVTDDKASDLKDLGMVTDAVLADVTGDKKKELVVVGEWMSPMVFEIGNKKIKEIKTNLSDYSGWWYAVKTDDVDGDGDQDLILGNRGENFYFSGTAAAPAKLWVWDFDGNKTYEKIITRTIYGRDVTVVLKDEITAQVVSLKKKNLLHAEFAKNSIQELFPSDVMRKAIMKEGNYFKSAIALNNGKGKFAMQPLPAAVQFSCVCGIYCVDLDGDNKKDLVLGGNDGGFMPQFSKLDASYGHILINKGSGNYEAMPNVVSKFMVKGEVKDILPIKVNGVQEFITVINNQQPKTFKIESIKIGENKN